MLSEELMAAFASCEEPSPLAIRVTSFPSPPPRFHPAAFEKCDKWHVAIATHPPQPSLFAARDSHPSPLAASPNDLHAETSMPVPAIAARLHGKFSLRGELMHA